MTTALQNGDERQLSPFAGGKDKSKTGTEKNDKIQIHQYGQKRVLGMLSSY